MAALAGGLIGQLFSLSPFMGLMPLTKAFIVVILGGLGGIVGAAVGGIILGLSESRQHVLRNIHGSVHVIWPDRAILLFRPQGLLSGRRVKMSIQTRLKREILAGAEWHPAG